MSDITSQHNTHTDSQSILAWERRTIFRYQSWKSVRAPHGLSLCSDSLAPNIWSDHIYCYQFAFFVTLPHLLPSYFICLIIYFQFFFLHYQQLSIQSHTYYLSHITYRPWRATISVTLVDRYTSSYGMSTRIGTSKSLKREWGWVDMIDVTSLDDALAYTFLLPLNRS